MAESVVGAPAAEPGVPTPQQQTERVPTKAARVEGPTPVLTPRILLKERTGELTNFELSEVLEYPRIYYYGSGANKIKGIPWAPNNHGYDDVTGDLRLVRNDHIAYRFQLLEKLGKGSFGQVVRVFDWKNNRPMAIKIIRNKKRFHQQAMVELRVLDHIMQIDTNDSHNIVRMTEHLTFRNHLCLVFELLGSNLYDCLRRSAFKGFAPSIVQRFSSQLLRCLELLHRERIIHCDLKPENILLREPYQTSIEVIDFGSSCFTNERVHTYIQSRFYRSPEVVLGMSYSTSIDMWSFACIAVELRTGHPLFAAENEHDLMISICQVLGLPSVTLLKVASRRKSFFDVDGVLLKTVDSRGVDRRPGSRPLSSLIPDDPVFLDFVTACLCWEPARRLTPQQALQHPFMLREPDTVLPEHLVHLHGDTDEKQLQGMQDLVLDAAKAQQLQQQQRQIAASATQAPAPVPAAVPAPAATETTVPAVPVAQDPPADATAAQ